MKEYYWKAIVIETSEYTYGCIFAHNEKEAFDQLASYNLYTMIEIEKEIK